MRGILLLTIVLLVGCTFQPGTWEWRPTERHTGEQSLAEDIWDCEIFYESQLDDILEANAFIRPFGAWGDFDFEWCMEQRGWRQQFIPK